MPTRQDFQNLSREWLKAARILYKNKKYDVAAYLLGYVVEFALKAVICKTLNLKEYPESGESGKIFKTHSFDILLTLSGMSNSISISGEPRLFKNWSELTKWSPEMRYEFSKHYTKQDIEKTLKALQDKPHGLLTWIINKKKW